jgi:hypothetical protein
MDDTMAVWKGVVKTNDPKYMGAFGTSTAGGMTLALVLRAKKEPLPAGDCAWSAMTAGSAMPLCSMPTDTI